MKPSTFFPPPPPNCATSTTCKQGRRPGEQVHIANVTDRRGVLVLAGPHARDVLAQVTEAPLDSRAFAG